MSAGFSFFGKCAPQSISGVRLNDEIAPKVYRLNRDLVDLGFEPHEALALDDASGSPIPRDSGEAFGPA